MFSCIVQVINVDTTKQGGAAALVLVQPSDCFDIKPDGEIQIRFTANSARLFGEGRKIILSLADKADAAHAQEIASREAWFKQGLEQICVVQPVGTSLPDLARKYLDNAPTIVVPSA